MDTAGSFESFKPVHQITCRAGCRNSTAVLKELVVFIFRVEEKVEIETRRKQVASLILAQLILRP
jgi:hypothetical protein